ncbi:MAG: Rrf2 family transcriptional regulator [Algicola sp.]|nr:Rrf2 family transcriptional regulator [Algicola sp.]
MKLTKHTDYAFRVLIYLAGYEKDKLATIKEVTAVFDISRDHVMKIVQKLAKAGFVDAIRGKFGGMKLGSNAADINLRDVVTLMEVTLAPVNCEEPPCRIAQGCVLQTLLFEAQELFLSHLGQYTLSDLIKPESETLYIIKALGESFAAGE